MPDLIAITLSNCAAIAPEMALIATLLLVLLADLAFLPKRASGVTAWIAIAGLLVSFALLMTPRVPDGGEAFFGALRLDSLALFFRRLFVVGAIAICFISASSHELQGYRQGEYYMLLLTATLGAMFLAAANDFLILVLALETLSLSSYVLAGYLRVGRKSAESAMKYVLFGGVAAAMMLFGFSYLYGLTGSLRLDALQTLAQPGASPIVFGAALGLVFVGVGFKIAAVPFHNWAPDVYEGAPTPVAAFLSVVSKTAGFAVLLRLVFQGGADAPALALAAEQMVAARLDVFFWVIAAATMTVGNFVALRQTDIQRLLAYSSIAHAGYILMVFAAPGMQAWDAALFYFVIYYLITIGAFYVAVLLRNETGSLEIRDCRGLWITAPYLVVAMVIFLVALTGLPPTAGFIGKLKLFKVLVDAGLGDASPRGPWFYFSLALIGVANSVVSLYYYFRIVKAMTLERFDTPAKARVGRRDAMALGALALAAVALGLWFSPALQFAQDALRSFETTWMMARW